MKTNKRRQLAAALAVLAVLSGCGGGDGGPTPMTAAADTLALGTGQTGSVLANDFSEVKARFFQNTTNPAYSPFHDVDGSSSVLANDFSAVKARFFHNLPPAPAGDTSVAGVTEDLFGSASIL